MGLPEPKFDLTGHCSVIYNDTVYAYSPAGFQSLNLKEDAEWQSEKMDISLTGAQCVKNDGEGLLYIVGGSPNSTAADWDYPGLMQYSFASKQWDWIRPVTWVTQNRQNHGATYISATKQILIYAGSQTTGDDGPSSSTFLIDTVSPFAVQGLSAASATPVVRPFLMPWDDSTAVMLGGGASQQRIFLFNNELGWHDLGTTLTQAIADEDSVKCTLVAGDDGSKVLEMYDMSSNPNKVSRYALLTKDGIVAAAGTTVGDNGKRDLTIDNWPKYNSTLAPTSTRSGFSIAQDDKGVAVVTGGNTQDPLCIFDQKANAWVNATELFNGQQVNIQSTPSSTPSATSHTSSASATTAASSSTAAAAPAAASTDNKNRMLTVLGATLGAIFGIAAILVMFLFCLKYRKSKRRISEDRTYIEKDRLSFADRGAEFMSEAGGSVGYKYNAQMNASQSSLAIVSGRTGSGHRKNMASDASTAGLVKKGSPLAYTEPMEMSKFDMKPEPILEKEIMVQNSNSNAAPRPNNKTTRSRSSGWSRYFANNEATNLAHMPSARSTYASERTSTGSQSLYPDSRGYSQPSQQVPPLDLEHKFDGQRISRVAKGSPTLGNSQENLPVGPMQAELARANSNGSSASGVSAHDHFYERAPVDSWTPVGNDYDRPASSNYTNSVVVTDHRDNASSYYPDNTSSFYPKSNFSSFYPGQGDYPDLPQFAPQERDSTVTTFPGAYPGANGPVKNIDELSMVLPEPPRIGGAQAGRDSNISTVTTFPRGVPDTKSKTGGQQDMSWLNLGAGHH